MSGSSQTHSRLDREFKGSFPPYASVIVEINDSHKVVSVAHCGFDSHRWYLRSEGWCLNLSHKQGSGRFDSGVPLLEDYYGLIRYNREELGSWEYIGQA
jgi:hypothetical protein